MGVFTTVAENQAMYVLKNPVFMFLKKFLKDLTNAPRGEKFANCFIALIDLLKQFETQNCAELRP